MLLSILIPTLESRRELFARMQTSLMDQIAAAHLSEDVELLWECDNRELTLGGKRNLLVGRAQGDFIAFVDDDDEVSPDYVVRICDAIRRRPEIDCIGITGIITFRGGHPRRFIHSLRYDDYSSAGGIYTRPPYHLNPMRRTIAAAFPYLELSYSEDIEWALRVRASRRLQSEEFIDAVLYYYHARRLWAYQWLLDRTETVRHRLGLRLVNRLRFHPAAAKAAAAAGAPERP